MTGKLVVTAQQSRFVPLDETDNRDIDIRNLCMAIGEREILQHATLTLKSGLRYVFCGRNGLGKTTVLRALAERQIPGILPRVRMVLLDQTMIENADKSMDAQSRQSTVIQNVLARDKHRQRLVSSADRLSTALQSTNNGLIAKTHRELELDQANIDLHAAQMVAQHRSGARGSQARKELLACEAAVERAEGNLTTASAANVDLDAATALLESLELSLNDISSSTTDSRARSVLIGLGFSPEQIDGPFKSLSGGWQTRAMLASVLIQSCDILMLDEPTNFLDLPAVIWLQHYLKNELPSNRTLVVTTHDRDFADAVAERLLILRIKPAFTLQVYTGTLSDHHAELHRQIKRMTRLSDNTEKKKAALQVQIQKSKSAARKSGDDKRMKQAMSKQRKLDDRMGLEIGAKGGRFKLNRDLGGYHLKSRADIEIPDFDPPVLLDIPSIPPELRNQGSIVSLEDVTFTYKTRKEPTLKGISLVIPPRSRTAIVGLNGSGKTTLVNIISEDVSSSRTSKGKYTGIVTKHPQARIAHYSQHETERLTAVGIQDPSLTALKYLHKLFPSMSEQEIRPALSGMGLSSAAQAETPLSGLSGGQLVRVALIECLLPHPPHLLILDEPTTHLDADSIVVLCEALQDYQGALLIVSHDRFLVRCVVEGQSTKAVLSDSEDDSDSDASETREPGHVYRITRTSGKIFELARGMDEYEEFVIKQLRKNGIDLPD